MAQFNWIYLDNTGGRHRVGLYHGDRTGHLMIHCNMRVVQIDFSVHDTKMYSFFVEDELCEVIVEKLKTGGFGYEFRVNKTVDTPRNRIRKVDARRNNRKLAIFIGGVVAVLGLAFAGLAWYGSQEDARKAARTAIISQYSKANMRRLGKEGKPATGYLHVEEINGKRVGVYLFKTADSTEIRGLFPVADTGKVLLNNGFPLLAGSAFETTYLPENPQIHRVELFRPVRSTIDKYIAYALASETHAHPDFSQKKCLCRVLNVAQLQNWTSLSNFIFQEKTPEENSRNNQESYARMLRDPYVEQAVARDCWDK